jgi:Protein of unknown function (DUF3108)
MSIRNIAVPSIVLAAVTTAAGPAAAADAASTAAVTTAAVTTAAVTTAAVTTAAAIAPFSAHYSADWKSMNVGSSDIELKPDAQPDHYVYTWTITARGVFRLYRAGLLQKSWFSIDAGHVRPEKYHAEDGASTVSLDFDWNERRATGTSEGKPVQFALADGIQDVTSIQVEVMLDLKNGNLPKTFQIVDKDEVKEFIYSQEGAARIRTDLGELDTVIVTSQRSGNNRILRMWFAPSLGYIPVQAERSRDGKLELAMRIKSVTR